MEAKIRAYIERAFADAPKTKKSMELQEELITNMIDKYNDKLQEGKTEEEAYTAVIAGMGDIGELVDGLRERQVLSQPTVEERRRSALLVAIAVGMYILSPIALIVFAAMFQQEILGLALTLILIAVATGLLVYNSAIKPRYAREEETFVEEFKEWKSGRAKEKSILDSFFAAFSLIVVAIYLIVSFHYGIWAYSWIIFIIAAAIRNIATAVFRMREGKK